VVVVVIVVGVEVGLVLGVVVVLFDVVVEETGRPPSGVREISSETVPLALKLIFFVYVS
jgi:hypothetical protein